MTHLPRISFGIIVLNGEPFTKYCLRQLYPFAHQIVVVEGATLNARGIARSDGHSRDGTCERLREFKETEDPENKITIVTAEDMGHPDGFWPGEKDEMSKAYAKRATGDYLWQVDVDEFYTEEAMQTVCRLLAEDPDITGASFRVLNFWGSLDVICDGFWERGLRKGEFRRLFRWGKGYTYTTHRPPTVHAPDGRDLQTMKWLSARWTRSLGIWLHHYSLLFPKQVCDKCDYYTAIGFPSTRKAKEWVETSYFDLSHPFRVHHVEGFLSWLEPYGGPHPKEIENMWRDLKQGGVKIETRDMKDVSRLLAMFSYRFQREILKRYSDWIYTPWDSLGLKRLAKRIGFFRHLRRLRSAVQKFWKKGEQKNKS